MWSTVIYIVLLLIGIVGYAYFLYVEIRNNKLREEGKEVRKKLDFIAVFSALMVLPVMHLTEKWLSSYITNEIAMFFFQILVLMVLLLAIGIPVRRIAKR
jgi:cell division protein FtsW (lipid II flippase)